MRSRRDFICELTSALVPLYGAREAEQIARMVVAERAGVSESALWVEPSLSLEIPDWESLLAQLSAGRPVQYVLGEAEFCGLHFRVREGCLIPRPETEELVDQILRCHLPLGRVLDVGTGSGCIAIALKKRAPESEITAIDYSPDALAIARENGKRLGVEVVFVEADALHLTDRFAPQSFDLIVSNPPYIPQSEVKEMRPNVTKYEPHEALFVPDEDPLRFYRAIARAAQSLLTADGSLWFEIHENFASEMQEMLHLEGFSQVEIRKDINDKSRMVWSRR